MTIRMPNQTLETNRRPAFALDVWLMFGRLLHAPACVSSGGRSTLRSATSRISFEWEPINPIFTVAQNLTAAEVRQILTSFLDGSGCDWDWDDFTSVPITDSRLDSIRERCRGLSEEFPHPTHYCSDAGIAVIQQFISQLTPSEPPPHYQT